jgi:hypothetical protein
MLFRDIQSENVQQKQRRWINHVKKLNFSQSARSSRTLQSIIDEKDLKIVKKGERILVPTGKTE